MNKYEFPIKKEHHEIKMLLIIFPMFLFMFFAALTNTSGGDFYGVIKVLAAQLTIGLFILSAFFLYFSLYLLKEVVCEVIRPRDVLVISDGILYRPSGEEIVLANVHKIECHKNVHTIVNKNDSTIKIFYDKGILKGRLSYFEHQFGSANFEQLKKQLEMIVEGKFEEH